MPSYLPGLSISCLLLLSNICAAQQAPDTLFTPKITPQYKKQTGPVVLIDEAHHNFHTGKGRFRPFALLLERDGYRIKRGAEPVSSSSLKNVDILVISNALHESDMEEWTLPNPSAFTDNEINSIEKWVKDGGALLLIADHMPFPGAAEKLASTFGFTFYNAFALTNQQVHGPEMFCYANGRLRDSPVVMGIDSIMTFTGQGFDIPEKAIPVLALDEEFYLLLPKTAWEFNENTTRKEAKGKYQGAILSYGKGKVAVFGEAAAFSAQTSQGMYSMGFNHPNAKHNVQFMLNVMHWLSD